MPWDALFEVFGSKMMFLTVWTVITRLGKQFTRLGKQNPQEGVFARLPTRLGEQQLATHTKSLA
jgi:hypothetical protein